MEHSLQVEYRSPDDLTPYARNARTHSPEQVAQIAGSIREFGFTNPILCDEQGTIIAGHGRLAAAQKLGLEKVPCITIAGLTDTQRRALILADNRIAETAGWDAEMLRVELEELTEAGADLDLIGFDEGSLDELIGGLEDDAEVDDTYSKSVDAPQYEPTGEHVKISDLCDTKKYKELIQQIDKTEATQEEKDFLKAAATRFIAFDFRKIAEFYAGQASDDVQTIMESLALVIIDYDDALKHGFVRLKKAIDEVESDA